jgi:hypothetical protein
VGWIRVGAKRKPNVLEELMKKDQEQKAAKRVECWLMKGLVVKVVAKELKSAGYYKAKVVPLPPPESNPTVAMATATLIILRWSAPSNHWLGGWWAARVWWIVSWTAW